MRRILSLLIALAVVAAPCAIVSAEAFASGGPAGHHMAAGHAGGASGQMPHCTGDPASEFGQDCATDCHSWNVSAAASNVYPQDEGIATDTTSPPAHPLWAAQDARYVTAAPLVGSQAGPTVAKAPIFALTERYRL